MEVRATRTGAVDRAAATTTFAVVTVVLFDVSATRTDDSSAASLPATHRIAEWISDDARGRRADACCCAAVDVEWTGPLLGGFECLKRVSDVCSTLLPGGARVRRFCGAPNASAESKNSSSDSDGGDDGGGDSCAGMRTGRYRCAGDGAADVIGTNAPPGAAHTHPPRVRGISRR